jgi:hypothetical protein
MWASIHSASRIRPTSEIIGVSADSCKDEVTGAVLLLLLVPDREPISIKVEDLDPIPAAVEEKEEMAGQRVLPKTLLDQSGETVEAFA